LSSKKGFNIDYPYFGNSLTISLVDDQRRSWDGNFRTHVLFLWASWLESPNSTRIFIVPRANIQEIQTDNSNFEQKIENKDDTSVP